MGTTRGRCRGTVLRAAPRLLGLYSVVALLSHELPPAERAGRVLGPAKAAVTFSDAPGSARLRPRSEGVFRRAGIGSGSEKLPEPVRGLLGRALAPAA